MTDLSELFAKEMRPSLGCTEPVAVGYATSLAYNAIWGRIPAWLRDRSAISAIVLPNSNETEISEIQVCLGRDIYKNALAVGVPRSGGRKGIPIAAAMGLFCYPRSKEQYGALFETLEPGDIEQAEALSKKVKVELVEGWENRDGLYIQVSVTLKDMADLSRSIVGRANIEGSHDNVTYLGVFEKTDQSTSKQERRTGRRLFADSIGEIMARLGEGLSPDVSERMATMLETNLTAADAGLSGEPSGLGVGAALRQLVADNTLGDDAVTLAQILVACATDVRMAGSSCGVMSTAGSGNQGITASLPLVAVAVKRGLDVRQLLGKRRRGKLQEAEAKQLDLLLQALALSNAVTFFVTYHLSYLSPMCGCAVKAGLGATAGIAYLIDGTQGTVEAAIQNMAGNITGLICDGAKEGCALKLTTAASAAITSAFLAASGVHIASDNGIIAEQVEVTIRNIGSVCRMMVKADEEIVTIMRRKAQGTAE